jgi:hypothetical protein
MAISLKDLRTQTPHSLKPLFDKYTRPKIAALVGCHPQYLRDILSGKWSPSPDLENRMQQVAGEIREAEKAER